MCTRMLTDLNRKLHLPFQLDKCTPNKNNVVGIWIQKYTRGVGTFGPESSGPRGGGMCLILQL